MLVRRAKTTVPAPEGLTDKDAVSTLLGLFDSPSPVVGNGRLAARLDPHNHSPERKGKRGKKRKATGKHGKKKKKKKQQQK
tara:strand:- start:227 stop:469 length:243 start_codon:yes stop_codon:yes gene_type:complete